VVFPPVKIIQPTRVHVSPERETEFALLPQLLQLTPQAGRVPGTGRCLTDGGPSQKTSNIRQLRIGSHSLPLLAIHA
jgi:hypothetical protein